MNPAFENDRLAIRQPSPARGDMFIDARPITIDSQPRRGDMAGIDRWVSCRPDGARTTRRRAGCYQQVAPSGAEPNAGGGFTLWPSREQETMNKL